MAVQTLLLTQVALVLSGMLALFLFPLISHHFQGVSGRFANEISLSDKAIKGFNLFVWEVVPRIYPQFLAFLFYRWEIIFRETAILGMLGIYTLGFYVDSAFEEIRYDRAMFLIVITTLINIGIDSLSRRIRRYLRLKTRVQCR